MGELWADITGQSTIYLQTATNQYSVTIDEVMLTGLVKTILLSSNINDAQGTDLERANLLMHRCPSLMFGKSGTAFSTICTYPFIKQFSNKS